MAEPGSSLLRATGCSKAVLSFQQVFPHFSERRARERSHLHEAARNFERGQWLTTSSIERVDVTLTDDVRDRHFAAQLVRHADDRRLGDACLLQQRFLDLARINVESA